MEAELIELYESAKKAADAAAGVEDSSPEEDRCVDALKQLKKFPVNYQLLVSTQVGKQLRHLTKHPRKKIQALASNLIGVWKNIIVEETTKSKKNGISVSKDSVKEESVHTSGAKKLPRVNSVKVEKVTKSVNAKLEKTTSSSSLVSETISKSETLSTAKKVENFDTVKTEKSYSGNSLKVEKEISKEVTSDARKPRATVKPIATTVSPPKMSSVILCKDPLRDKVRELLSEALLKVSGEVGEELREEADASDPYRVAVSLESAMFEWRTYMRKMSQEKKRTNFSSPSSSVSYNSSYSSSSTASSMKIKDTNERNFFDTGGVVAAKGLADEEEIQKGEYSMEEIWNDLVSSDDDEIKPVCPTLASPVWDYCQDSFWITDQGKDTNMFLHTSEPFYSLFGQDETFFAA